MTDVPVHHCKSLDEYDIVGCFMCNKQRRYYFKSNEDQRVCKDCLPELYRIEGEQGRDPELQSILQSIDATPHRPGKKEK